MKPSNLNEGTETFIALFDLETDDIARARTVNEETEAALKAKGMRVFAGWSFGEAPALHDLPIPAADESFLIHVSYAGVNPVDYKQLLRQPTATSTYLLSGLLCSLCWPR